MADNSTIHGLKGAYRYTAYIPYYPTRFQVSDELQNFRQVVWDFKDGGISKEVAEILADAASDDLSDCQPRNNWWLCVIPASTAFKTQTRFQEFCSEFCRLTGFNNGYHLITNTDDREAKHLEENRNAVNILEHMAFSDIRGKSIILFDDVYTTGKSFLNVASKLSQLGAAQVRGLFLGKTHWLNEDGSVNTGFAAGGAASYEPDGDDYEPDFDDYNDRDSYGDYAGTYAQDEMGLSDDFINDVLDGDPDAYWNID